MRDFKIFATIADIHIGRQSISASTFKKQLKKHFFDVINNFRYLDGIFVCGDILHTIISLNSENAEVFSWFISQLYKTAKKKGSTVIILRGTLSHDGQIQLNAAKEYQNNDDGVDFRVYDTIAETTIWGDYKVLILPDVKIKQLQDIDQYLDEPDKYDLILGHGTIDRMQFFIQESEELNMKTYLYDVDKLIRCSKGPVMFGHIHQYQAILNHFYYVGSFTTLERGTTNPGFLVSGIYDKDRSKFVVNHYANPDSAEYLELVVSKHLIDEYPIDDIMETIDEIIANRKDNDLITLRIMRGDERDSADKVLMLEDRYRKDKRFSIIKKVKSKREEEVEKKNQDLKDKYSYAFDQKLEMYEILWKYYQEDFLPTIEDPQSEIAKLTEDSFRRVLQPPKKG